MRITTLAQNISSLPKDNSRRLARAVRPIVAAAILMLGSAANAWEYISNVAPGSSLAIGSQIGSGKPRVFFRAGANALYACDQQPNGTWVTSILQTFDPNGSAIHNVAGNIVIDDFSQFQGGTASVFYRGTDNRVWWASPSLFMGGWVWNCRPVSAVPCPGKPVSNSAYSVVYRSTDNRVWSTWYDGSGQWKTGCWTTSNGTAPNNVTQDLTLGGAWGEIFYRGADACLWRAVWTSSGFAYSRVSTLANLKSSPAYRGYMDLVYQNTSGGLSQQRLNGSTWAHSVWRNYIMNSKVLSPQVDSSTGNCYVWDGSAFILHIGPGGLINQSINTAWGTPSVHSTHGVYWPSAGIYRW